MVRRGLFASRMVLAALGALALGACGSSGDGNSAEPTPTPTPTAGPPVFTSSGTASVVSGTSGIFYNAAATDPTNEALTYSLTGGADQALFQITTAGALSFRTPPVFDPATGGDNSYTVQLTVTDGTNPVNLTLTVTVVAPDFRVRRVATGFNQPVFLFPVTDDTGRVYVVERTGRIRILNTATGAIAAAPFLDLTSQISTDGERGLLGFTLAPDFATSRNFYVFLTNTAGTIEVRRYRATSNDVADPATGDVVLSIAHPRNNHNGGWIGFGADNFLYVTVGDGGGSGDPDNNAQNRNVLLGKILRIDPATDAFTADANRDYAIPTTNPFATTGGAPEVIAIGLRNPYRAAFDFSTRNLIFGDVGQDAIEEINLLIPGDTAVANFGWPTREGTQPFKAGDATGLIAPVAEYAHGTGPLQGNSVTGGYVYRGPVTSLQGSYFFGDFVTPNIWSIPVGSLVRGTTVASSAFTVRTQAFVPDAGAITNISSFGQDRSSNLYVVDYDGEIFVIERKP